VKVIPHMQRWGRYLLCELMWFRRLCLAVKVEAQVSRGQLKRAALMRLAELACLIFFEATSVLKEDAGAGCATRNSCCEPSLPCGERNVDEDASVFTALKTPRPELLRADETTLERLAFEGALEARLREGGIGESSTSEPRIAVKVRRRPTVTPSVPVSASSKAGEDGELEEKEAGVCTSLKKTGLCGETSLEDPRELRLPLLTLREFGMLSVVRCWPRPRPKSCSGGTREVRSEWLRDRCREEQAGLRCRPGTVRSEGLAGGRS